MIRIGCATAALAVAFLVSTTASAQTPVPQTTRQPETAAAAPFDARTFIEKMTVVNLAETHLGRMAQQQGEDDDVKDFGGQMVKDHKAANETLQQIAAKLKVKTPTELDAKHRDLADKLSKLRGAQFDREYITAMVQGHEEVRSMLLAQIGSQRASPSQNTRSNASETEKDLREWTRETLTHVEQHLEEAREIQKELASR